MSKNKKGAVKLWVVFLIIFVVLVIGAGGAAAYYFYFRMTPEKIMQKAQTNLENLKSFRFDDKTTIKTTNSDSKNELANLDAKIEATGSINASDKNNQMLESKIKLEIGSSGVSLNGLGEFKVLEHQLFFKLDEIPLVDMIFDKNTATQFNKEIKGKWFFEDTKNVAQSSGSNNNAQIIQEQIAKNKFWASVESLKQEQVNGVNCYQFKVKMDKKAVADIVINSLKSMDEKLTSDEQNQIRDSINKSEDIYATMWIGKKDYNVYKVKADINDNQNNVSTSSEVVFSDHNKTIKIEKPANALDFEATWKKINKKQKIAPLLGL